MWSKPDREKRPKVESLFQERPRKTTRERKSQRRDELLPIRTNKRNGQPRYRRKRYIQRDPKGLEDL